MAIHIPDGQILDLPAAPPAKPGLWNRLTGRTPPTVDVPTEVRAFGWIDPDHDFPRGSVGGSEMAVFAEAARQPLWRVRQWTASTFLPPQSSPGPLRFPTTALSPKPPVVTESLVVSIDGGPSHRMSTQDFLDAHRDRVLHATGAITLQVMSPRLENIEIAFSNGVAAITWAIDESMTAHLVGDASQEEPLQLPFGAAQRPTVPEFLMCADNAWAALEGIVHHGQPSRCGTWRTA